MFSYKNFIRGWDRFFFSPVPTEGIAVFRIVWMLLLLTYFLFDLANIADFYGPHAVISLETTRSQFPVAHMNIFHWFGNSYPFMTAFMTIYGLAIFSALFGFCTRPALGVVLICLVSLHQRNIWLLSSSELLMRAATILLVCSPCGHTLSIDAILAKRGWRKSLPREWAPWALRLIQIQLSVVYLWTVWHKLKGDSWFDGTALYYATRIEAMTNFPVPYFLDAMWFIKIATWGTLLVEISLGTLIWFKEFRRPVILIGFIFHFGIEYMMSIPFFEFVMMALLINFYTPEEHRAMVRNLKSYLLKLMHSLQLPEKIKGHMVSWIGDSA